MNATRNDPSSLRAIAVFVAVVAVLAGVSAIPDIGRLINHRDRAGPTALSIVWALAPGVGAYAAFHLYAGIPLRQAIRHLAQMPPVAGWLVVAAVAAALQPLVLAAATRIVFGLDVVPTGSQVLAAAGSAIFLLIAAAVEEAGWRGFLLPALQSRMPAIAASLGVGVVWFFWHTPLMIQGGTNQHVPLWWYPVVTILASITYAAIFNSAGGAVIVTAIIHGTLNATTAPIVNHLVVTGQPTEKFYAIALTFYVASALLVIVLWGPANLGRTKVVLS